MRNLLFSILRLPASLLIVMIRVYQKTLSPDHGLMRHAFRYGVCRHSPTCSEYAIEQLRTRSLPVAIYRSIRRIISCNPWTTPTENKLREVIDRL